MKIHFFNVEWDTDGKSLYDCDLESDFVRNVEIDDDIREDELDDFLSDWLSDEFGYCHFGFDYEIIEE